MTTPTVKEQLAVIVYQLQDIKEDLAEIKELKRRVEGVEKSQTYVKGAIAMVVAIIPFIHKFTGLSSWIQLF